MHPSTPRVDARAGALVALLFTLLLAPAAFAAEVRKSPADHRDYEAFTLENGLQVVVISDPQADKAAASLDVHVGSASDPPGREGLSHFLEHMLFLGTEKYPGAGEYQQFISAHGGSHNAYTAFENTNYFFDVDAGYLEPTLDRFSQFFVAPLFTERYVQQERNAVDSEYQSKLREDGWRVVHAWKSQANPRHPYARYFGGNAETLADRAGSKVRDELIAFWKRHYSADRMALAVLGREPTATLRRWVEERFAAVPTGAPPTPVTDEPLFEPGKLPRQVNVEPVREQRTLALMWPIPETETHTATKPTAYISNLLGHEGQGSLLSLLKARGWAEGLHAGAGISHADSAVLQVGISLTQAGLDHVDEIVREVFAYVGLVRDQGVLERLFEENRKLAEIGFQFASPAEPRSAVRHIASALHHYPATEVLRGPVTFERFDPALIRDYLARLTPGNLLLVLIAPGLHTPLTTDYFGARYGVEAISEQRLAAWQPEQAVTELAIPPPNEFVPDELSVKPLARDAAHPERLVATPLLELWFQQDATWRLPRADFYFSVRSPRANSSPRDAVLTDLYVEVVKDELNEFSYPAMLAGLDYDLYRHSRGFSVRMSGYDQKQPLLLQRLGNALADPEIAATRFVNAKDELLRKLRNAAKERPYERAMDELGYLLLTPAWSEEERIAALEPLGSDDLRAFVPELLAQVSVVALAHGNLLVEDARALAGVLRETVLAGSQAVDVSRVQVVKLEADVRYGRVLQVEHEDAAVAVYFQGAERSFAERARYNLLAQLISAPFYTELRTEQQLGYVVFASPFSLLEVPGVAFVAQSPRADADALSSEVMRFLVDFQTQLNSMEEATFERNRAALLARVTEEDNDLRERSDRYWSELDREQYAFDSRERMAEAIGGIDRESFARFYARALLGDARRQLTVRAQQAPLAVDAADTRVVTDAARFKAVHELYTHVARDTTPAADALTGEGVAPCDC